MKDLKESGTTGHFYRMVMSSKFEDWYEDSFQDFLEGNDETPGDIQKEIENLFDVDTKTAIKIFDVLMGNTFETWYDNDFMDYVEGRTKDKNKILKQIKNLLS